jgi:hypothetical protein
LPSKPVSVRGGMTNNRRVRWVDERSHTCNPYNSCSNFKSFNHTNTSKTSIYNLFLGLSGRTALLFSFLLILRFTRVCFFSQATGSTGERCVPTHNHCICTVFALHVHCIRTVFLNLEPHHTLNPLSNLFLSVWSVSLAACESICPPICLSFCLSVCLSALSSPLASHKTSTSSSTLRSRRGSLF